MAASALRGCTEQLTSSEAVAEERLETGVCEKGLCSLRPEREQYTLPHCKGPRTPGAGVFFDLQQGVRELISLCAFYV